MMRLLTSSQDSIMPSNPPVRSYVSTGEWTETETLNSQLDYPMGKYWITWVEGQDKTTGSHRLFIVIRPDSWAWDWHSKPNQCGEVGRKSLSEYLWIQNLGSVSC